MSKRTPHLTTVTVTLWILAFAGCSQPPPRAEPPPPKVAVQQADLREIIDYDQFNGWIDSSATVEVRARVRGHIAKVRFTDGQLVEKGQLLFELDPRPFQAEVDRAKGQLRIFEAQLRKAVAEEARIKEMFAQQVASQKEMDIAEAATDTFEAEVDSANQEIVRRELELEYSRITAPISGRISRAMLTEGNLVGAGGSDPLLTTIVSVSPVYVYFNVDERTLQRYRRITGRDRATTVPDEQRVIPVRFGLDSDEGYPHQAVLNYADNRVDPATGTIIVRAEATDLGRIFTPGSRARVRVPLGEARASVLVPDVAVLSDQDKKYLLVLDEKNVVQRRDVQLGKLLDDGMRVVVPAAGAERAVAPNEWFVVEGLQSARLNYPVEPIRRTDATTQPARVAAAAVPAAPAAASAAEPR